MNGNNSLYYYLDDFVDRERRFDSMCNKVFVDLESLEFDEDFDFI